jgi:hypothetical protein
MRSDNKNTGRQTGKIDKEKTKVSGNTQDLDQLSRDAEKERTRKPGSQSNSSNQGNNGRGGGK